MPSAIALIPARSGSERVKDKNIRPLAGHPLLAYAIATARQAGIFDRVICSTDSTHWACVTASRSALRSASIFFDFGAPFTNRSAASIKLWRILLVSLCVGAQVEPDL